MPKPDNELSPQLSALLADVALADSIEDCGHIDLADADPRKNRFRGPWAPRTKVKVADIYVGGKFQERCLLLRDGCPMPPQLYMPQWQRRAEYCRN